MQIGHFYILNNNDITNVETVEASTVNFAHAQRYTPGYNIELYIEVLHIL